MNFAYDYEVDGEKRTIVLKSGGEDILVTEKNKEEFIEYVDGLQRTSPQFNDVLLYILPFLLFLIG